MGAAVSLKKKKKKKCLSFFVPLFSPFPLCPYIWFVYSLSRLPSMWDGNAHTFSEPFRGTKRLLLKQHEERAASIYMKRTAAMNAIPKQVKPSKTAFRPIPNAASREHGPALPEPLARRRCTIRLTAPPIQSRPPPTTHAKTPIPSSDNKSCRFPSSSLPQPQISTLSTITPFLPPPIITPTRVPDSFPPPPNQSLIHGSRLTAHRNNQNSHPT